MFNKIRLLIVCLLIAGAASAQTFYVLKPGNRMAWACVTPRLTETLYEGFVLSDGDPEFFKVVRAELLDAFDRRRCIPILHDYIFHRWDSDEEFPEQVGVRETITTLDGLIRAKGRTYWTRKEWLEEAR